MADQVTNALLASNDSSRYPPTRNVPDVYKGTLTDATDKSAKPDDEAKDTSGIRSVLESSKTQMSAILRRIQSANRQKDALVPPTMVKPPKAPEQQDTPMTERWGSLAMTLAAMGGLMTRQPLTASLNAMAAVNHAFNEGDAEKAKNAFATWKVENENAIKQNEFAVKSYEGALKKIETDYHGAVAEIGAMAAARKDEMPLALINSGRIHEAIQMITGYAGAANQYSERADIVKAHMEQKVAFRAANPNATPAELAAADLAIMTNKFGEKPETTGGQQAKNLSLIAAADFEDEHKRPPATDPKDPNFKSDKVELARLEQGQKVTDRLAGSPYMQGLNAQEGAAVQRAIAADPTLKDDPQRLGQIIHQATGRNVLTPGQVEEIDNHGRAIGHAMDAIDRIKASLAKASGVAGGLGRPLRGAESIGDILGFMDDTTRADFRADLSYLQYEAPDLLKRKTSAAQSGKMSPQVEDMISNQKWGDTFENVSSRIATLQGILTTDIRGLNTQYKGATGEELPLLRRRGASPAPTAKAPDDAAHPVEGKKYTDKHGNVAVYRNGKFEEVP